jgi:hypothetical protein
MDSVRQIQVESIMDSVVQVQADSITDSVSHAQVGVILQYPPIGSLSLWERDRRAAFR